MWQQTASGTVKVLRQVTRNFNRSLDSALNRSFLKEIIYVYCIVTDGAVTTQTGGWCG